jgi:CubicO group peptidase (beta-lactamase class C family)
MIEMEKGKRGGRHIWRPAAATALVMAVCLTASGQAAASAGDGRAAKIEALLDRYAELGMLNGTALVAAGGAVLVEKGFGMADFELGVPNRPDTKQWIGSITKVFTATAVVKLADAGKLSLDDHVSDLLPWYRKDTGARVTVRQLLDHTSGIPDYMHLPGVGREGFRREVGDDPIDVKAFAQKWCSGDLQWEPGSRWGYSNSGYVLLGAIVERVAGSPFDQVVKTLVLSPAGMEGTVDLAARPRSVVAGLAEGYEKMGDALVTRRPWNISTTFAAGGMVSTVGDLYRFDRALYRDDFVSAKAREAMFTPGLGHYGCGWEVTDQPIGPGKAVRTVAGHEGFLFWSLARIYRIPQDQVFVALVNNTGDTALPAIFAGVADILYGREPAWPKPSAARAVYDLAAEKGAEVALARYRELQAREPEAYVFDERGLNLLGYGLLQEGKPGAALGIFRFMVDTYPSSANAYDSLGEGLAAAGRREEAVKAYARSLELDPSSRNAAAQITKLLAE